MIDPNVDGVPSRRQVVAFDFDGTITKRDTLAGFLTFVGGQRAVATAVARESAILARGLRSSAERNAAKERLLGRVLGGRHVDEVTEAGARYAERLPQRFRPESVAEIADHREAGRTLVIVSASLVYYLRPLAADLGFADVIGVEMHTDDAGRLTGALAGPNVRREEKERRLREWLGDAPVELWAYGDSAGDEHLLAMADHPTWVGKRATRNA